MINNLELIKQYDLDYFKRRVTLSVTISPPASYRELDEFFSELGMRHRIGIEEVSCQEEFERLKQLEDFDFVVDKFIEAGIKGYLGDLAKSSRISLCVQPLQWRYDAYSPS